MPPENKIFILRNTHLSLDEDEAALQSKIAARLKLHPDDIVACRITRKGVDARKKSAIKLVYTVALTLKNTASLRVPDAVAPDLEELLPAPSPLPGRVAPSGRIVIVGSGPAGMFAALRLVDCGAAPILLERGRGIEERVRDVERFWRDGILDCESNVQFGEGGAGTFSDGKLTTRVRDANSGYVLRRFVEFGAPAEIEWLAKPHIGSDRLRAVMLNMRKYLLSRGVDVRFGAKMTGITLHQGRMAGVVINDSCEEPCDALLLAPGHSSRDTYAMLEKSGVALEQKPFAVGFRVEHPQELINSIQYGLKGHPKLPQADYALAWNAPDGGRSAYSFCMCPGGVVIGCSTEPETIVTNGMSNLARASGVANSALVATVRTTDFGSSAPLAGVEFQRKYEQAAFKLGGGGYRAPAQSLPAFLGRKKGALESTFRPGVTEAELAGIFPEYITATLQSGIEAFDRKMRGFITAEATLIGVESRTSAPVRIVRGEDFQSTAVAGLYPCGEGAGYAGGIMSAALDGIRVADAIAAKTTE
ncbi:MAG: hypothetical protein FIA91_10060 [Geobacter sp.]|nr:hypothetical protein [Geobacter sp.]